MNALKPYSLIARANTTRNLRSRARHTAGLTLVLVALMSCVALPCPDLSVSGSPGTLGLVPTSYASSQTASLAVNAWTSNGPEGANISSLAIDPSNPNIIYACGSSVFKSTNGGATWSAIDIDRLGGTALAINPSYTNTVYLADAGTGEFCDGGLVKSTDAGASWSDTGFFSCYPYGLAIAPNSPNTIYAIGNGLENTTTFPPPPATAILAKSIDGGANWSNITPLNTDFNSLAIDPSNSSIVYLSYGRAFGGVYKSTDGGASWNATDAALPVAPDAFAIDPTNTATLYAGTRGRGVYKSTNGGANWRAINIGLTNTDIRALGIDPSNPGTLYAGTQGGGVFTSTDGGTGWSEFNVGLTNVIVFSLAIDRSGTSLHAGTDAGVFDYHYGTSCADSISPTSQSLDAGGGAGSVEVSAGSECSWTAASYASWITVTSGSSSGNGSVSYSVAANTSTSPRKGTLIVDARVFTVTQAGLAVKITSASVTGKKLLVTGENFDPGAVILLNGEEQKTRNDDQNPKTTLIGKKAGKKVKPEDKLQVRNPNGTLSEEFTFTGP